MAFCWLAACPVTMAQHLSEEEIARHIRTIFNSTEDAVDHASRSVLKNAHDPRVSRILIQECEKTNCFKSGIIGVLAANNCKEAMDFINEYEKKLLIDIQNSSSACDSYDVKHLHIYLAGTMYIAGIDKDKYRSILKAYAKDKYEGTRCALAAKLENIPEAWAIEILYDMYENDPQPQPKYCALDSLIRLEPHEKLRKHLLSHCKKPEYMIQYMQHEFPEFDMSEPEAK